MRSAYEWAADVAGWLAEELATGMVRRARRTVRDGYVLLNPRDAHVVRPTGCYVDSVPPHGQRTTARIDLAHVLPALPRRYATRSCTMRTGPAPCAWSPRSTTPPWPGSGSGPFPAASSCTPTPRSSSGRSGARGLPGASVKIVRFPSHAARSGAGRVPVLPRPGHRRAA